MEKIGFVLPLFLVGLLGCSSSDERLHDLQRDLDGGISKLRPGEKIEVHLPFVKEGERIVFINGRYVGSVCESGDLAESLRQELDLRFGASEGAAAFAVLVSNKKILDAVSFDETLEFSNEAREEGNPACAMIIKKSRATIWLSCGGGADQSVCHPVVTFGK